MPSIKNLFLFVLINAFCIVPIHAQSISCQELFEIVTENYESKDEVTCYLSSMLTKATYYQLEGMGFVVGYIKSNDFDLYGKPYIFCGISTARWRAFKSAGVYGSWGESFHEYIREYTCDCN
ncbi:MAG: hypothetical protein CMC70_04255 [Flavobacteriaceae bacterium]|nr:hypothetical protein [Flavobacteriaceae bacterium]